MNIHRLFILSIMSLFVTFSFAPGASASDGPPGPRGDSAGHRTHFAGAHPISSHIGKGYCYIQVPHIHAYAPEHPELYQEVDHAHLFVGDPVPFGYDGPKHVWYGHHPVYVGPLHRPAPSPHFCWMKGPHYHAYAAPPTPEYQRQNDVIFFMGPIPGVLVQERPRREEVLEIAYRPYVKLRPQVVVVPPPLWQGTVWVIGGPSVGVVVPGVQVVTPNVVVHGGSKVYVKSGRKHDNGRRAYWYEGKHSNLKKGHGEKGNGKKGHGHKENDHKGHNSKSHGKGNGHD